MKLNGQTIPTPRQNMSIDFIELSRSERAVTGRMVKEIITTKKRFSIPYHGLKPEEALIFIDPYESGQPVLFEYEGVRGPQTAIVYVTGVPHELYSPKPQYAQNITITLEEK